MDAVKGTCAPKSTVERFTWNAHFVLFKAVFPVAMSSCQISILASFSKMKYANTMVRQAGINHTTRWASVRRSRCCGNPSHRD